MDQNVPIFRGADFSMGYSSSGDSGDSIAKLAPERI